MNIILRLEEPMPRRAEWMFFFKIGCCLRGLGIVGRNRRKPNLKTLKESKIMSLIY